VIRRSAALGNVGYYDELRRCSCAQQRMEPLTYEDVREREEADLEENGK